MDHESGEVRRRCWKGKGGEVQHRLGKTLQTTLGVLLMFPGSSFYLFLYLLIYFYDVRTNTPNTEQ